MKGEKLIEAINRGVDPIIKYFAWVASVVLGMMVLLLTTHILGRFLFAKPLLGTAEIAELMLCTVVWLVVVYAEIARGHIRVTLVVERFPRRMQSIVGRTVYFLSGAFFIAMGWQSALMAQTYLFPEVRASYLLSIPTFPFIIIIVIGSLLLGVKLLMKCFHPLITEKVGKGGLNN